MSAPEGVAPPGSPYRYVAMAPRHPIAEGRTTTLARIDRDGGEIDRWWFLRGHWITPVIDDGGGGGGLSADGGTLVLAAYRYAYPRSGRWTSRFAVVDTRVEQGFDEARRETLHPVKRFGVRGDFRLASVSADGSTVYLTRYPHHDYLGDHEVWAYDVASDKLRPGAHSSSPPERGRENWLAFARAPRQPGNLLARQEVIGHSVQGRPIELRQLGDPRWSGELLVFGCIHGDECAAGGVAPLTGGCPDPSADIFLVPDLNPDGAAEGSRLNARSVDLNRNFPSGWRPSGRPGDPEYPGRRPFSEPETRLAARIIRALDPAATIWFHQYRGARPFVRAWGQSVPAARRFAALTRMPFRLMRWPAGTGPNWQTTPFPGLPSSSSCRRDGWRRRCEAG